MSKNRLLFACALGLFLSFPTTAFAGSECGFYLGAGLGQTDVEISDFDESDSAYKIFGGYNFGNPESGPWVLS